MGYVTKRIDERCDLLGSLAALLVEDTINAAAEITVTR